MPEICNSIDSVMLVYTNKCNISCDHCLYDCSPEKKEKLKLEEVLSLLDCFPEFKIKRLAIAGGEPLIYLGEVLKIISKAKKQGLKTTLLSNGFWAPTEKQAEKTVCRLKNAGLNCLKVSCDEFHQKFIPQKNIFHIFSSAKKHSLPVYFNFSFLNDFLPLDFVAKQKNFFEKTNLNKEFFKVSFTPVVPVGRACEKIQRKKFVVKQKVFKEKCPLREMSLSYSGKGFACCNVFFDKSPVFMLNNSGIGSPKNLLESYQKSPLVFYLRNKGSFFVSELAKKHRLKKASKVKRPAKKYVSFCDYCQANLNQYLPQDLNKMLLKEFEKGNY